MPTKKTGVKTIKKVENISPVVEKSMERVEIPPTKKGILIPLLVGAIVVAAFAVGYLYGKVSVYEKGSTTAGTGTTKTGQPTAQQEPTVTLDTVKSLFADKSNVVFGDANKKVLFVEFSDPSCPYCHIAAGKNTDLLTNKFATRANGGTYVPPVPEMKKLVDEGKAGYVWVFSPGHGNGELATQAFYCAKDQNKFWEVHDLLMSNKGYTLLNETIKNDITKADQMAEFLKAAVDSKTMLSCLQSGKYAGRIQSDEALGQKFGVNGTPSFFVNAQNFAGAYSYADMQSVVDAAMK